MITFYVIQATLLSRLLMLWIGWLLDRLFGDPPRLPHLIVGFGKLIAMSEKKWNQGNRKRLKGGIVAVLLILLVAILSYLLIHYLPTWLSVIIGGVLVYYCLAGTTLIEEVKAVFSELEESLDRGRVQLARIVGRDTQSLDDEECKQAALETLSENLSDGVIAPLFWFALLGVPGMVAYKMINTLDSMIGYKNERYMDFGFVAAKIDDVANYIPSRLTALLMLLVNKQGSLWRKVKQEGKKHTSPNSGYPEAALALMLGCQFGGPHYYGGVLMPKPYIGNKDRELTSKDLQFAVQINRGVDVLMLFIISIPYLFIVVS